MVMAGVTGLEPATFGVTGHLVSQGNQGVFRLLMRRNGQEIRQELERMAACRAEGCWYGPLPACRSHRQALAGRTIHGDEARNRQCVRRSGKAGSSLNRYPGAPGSFPHQ